MLESSNPALKKIPSTNQETASVGGVINKTIILFTIMLLGGWGTHEYLGEISSLIMIGALVVNFIVAMVYIFNPTKSFLAPIYAVTEGVLLYSISNSYEAQYPGIVTNALVSTLGVFTLMLFLYRSGIIKVTQGFYKFMMISMGSILFLYIGSFIASMFGVDISFMTGNSDLSIGISVGIVIIASLTLILDFNRIEEAVRSNAPKNYEWYLSFGLILSLVWLYLEILRLLAKAKSRD